MSPKTLDRRFVEPGGVEEIPPECILVGFNKRSHNPVLREAALDKQPVPSPGWATDQPNSQSPVLGPGHPYED